MDRLHAHIVATALLTAALAALPVAMDRPTSAASTTRTGGTARPSALTRPPARGLPAPAASTTAASRTPASSPAPFAAPGAQQATEKPTLKPTPAKPKPALVPIPCPDAYQVGTTAYARWHGMIAFSVKQFYSPSCHAVYGYTYPWLQFRALKQDYDLGLGVFDLTHDAIVGARTFIGGTGGPDFWSAPFVPAADTCTQGLAHAFFPDTETDTFTIKYCV